jgi:hypothetical protein
MNRLVGFIAIATLLVVGSAQSDRQPTGTQVGRYQLFQGEFGITGATAKQILRIDTATGHVSYMLNGFDSNGRPTRSWEPVKELEEVQIGPR